VAPRDEDKNLNDDALMEMVSRLTRSAAVLQSIDGDKEDSTAKGKGWKERLEKLKIKKAEERKVVETNAGQDLDAESLKKEFAPTSGIKFG